ncbi:molybdopterin-binding/glycosyltransferase family 2 protein [Amorphus orientalis]|uniref:Molybdenum cofactor cytidylyltransferase n=1 Tax=Amorphus orientalis TaxID=649198 RepID=A0AAE4ATU3_9HYPH|nr:molybdopterin-binding/glycosyltransferase family 2 protein [Amorphus orientalis]MDQ0316575.1 molybdenum cofactor cytidylyltransferase [Amorphus orientalis]
MKFGPVPVDEAEGAILAHTVRLSSGVLKKGTVLDAEALGRLREDGIADVVAAVLAPGDVDEDAAAGRLASAVAGPHIRIDDAFTGRANLFATEAGVFQVDRAAVDRLNRVGPSVTLATLEDRAAVEAGRMIATVKIIPFAVEAEVMARAEEVAGSGAPLLSVAPFRPMRVGVVSTLLPGLKPSIVDKTLKILGDRLAPAGARIEADERVAHEAPALADALARLADGPDLLIVFGASAVVDRHDVIPEAIERAGGTVDHFGMPVDPGNLLLIGRLAGRPVIGAPGCARSPKENGFDWVLNRTLAGLDVTPDDIVGLGVGGLLMEIVSRPQPRSEPTAEREADSPTVAALVLAAGRSTRMGSPKMLATIDGMPLVRRVVEAAAASRADPIVVVTGHGGDAVRGALDGLSVQTVDNPSYADGLSTSVRAGLAALPDEADAALVLLGDMPMIEPAMIDRLIDAFDPEKGALIVVPTHGGKRGNPVLWSRRFFTELMAVTGDKGGRDLLAEYPDAIVEVELGEAAAMDVDTREVLADLGGQPAEGSGAGR